MVRDSGNRHGCNLPAGTEQPSQPSPDHRPSQAASRKVSWRERGLSRHVKDKEEFTSPREEGKGAGNRRCKGPGVGQKKCVSCVTSESRKKGE